MERKDNTGALFSNAENKKTDKHPDYKGKALVNGKEMNMSAWLNTSKAGKKYLSLSFDDYKPKTEAGNTFTSTATDSNAEIPF